MYFDVITSSLEALYMSCHEISQLVMSCYDSYEHYIKYIKITCFNVSEITRNDIPLDGTAPMARLARHRLPSSHCTAEERE